MPEFVTKLSRAVFRSLPISGAMRDTVRDRVFRTVGRRVAAHPGYHQWLSEQASARSKTLEAAPMPSTSAGSETPPIKPDYLHYDLLPRPEAPDSQEWYRLALRLRDRPSETPHVDIIIPVYGGYHESLRAIFNAVSAPHTTPAEVIVINDASPDGPLVRTLRRLAGMGLFTLLENEENLGFVRTVNRCMALHTDRDVLLLNADCLMYGDAIDRLRALAQGSPDIATVTPLTNHGDLASYPLGWQENPWRNEISDQAMDTLAARVNGNAAVEVPTGIGYCLYIRREALQRVGLFDANIFGRGYGEENDFCRRALTRGYRHLLAGGIFVRHLGGVSFQHEKQTRITRAMGVMETLHPGYFTALQQWKDAAPDKPLRIALDLARLNTHPAPGVLMVLHNWGGGTEKHVCDLARWLEEEGFAVWYVKPVVGDGGACQLERFTQGKPQHCFTPNLQFRLRDERAVLEEVLRQLDIRHVHIHHLVDWHREWYPAWPELARVLGATLDVTVHDYFAICPRTSLITGTGRYCGEPEAAACNRCLAECGSPVAAYEHTEPEVGAWRQLHGALLAQARKVFVPGRDVKTRLERYFPDVAFTVRPHPETPMTEQAAARPRTPDDGQCRVALLGVMNPLKGQDVLAALAEDAAARDLPVRFHLLGFAMGEDAALTRHGNVLETGRYKEEDLPALVQASGADRALFLSVCPETYSYTLSLAFQLGLYPLCFDIGTPAERIRDAGWGTVLPYAMSADPAALNDALLALDVSGTPSLKSIAFKAKRTPRIWEDYYGLAPLQTSGVPSAETMEA